MTSNQIIDLMNQSPFRPFLIRLSDGTSVHVSEPFQVATKRNSPICIVYADDDRTHLLSIRNITSLVVDQDQDQRSGN